MKISELKPGVDKVTIELAEVTAIEEPRDVLTRFGRKARVANATIKDETGEITLSLWGEDIDRIAIGDKIRIENGWVSEFRGSPQISAGKYGKIIKIE